MLGVPVHSAAATNDARRKSVGKSHKQLVNSVTAHTYARAVKPVLVGKWGSDNTKNGIARALAEQLKGFFAEYGVDVVLQGHDHMVSRTRPLNGNGEATEENIEEINGIKYIKDPYGVIYVMNGPAGDQAKGESSIYKHDESLYAYALPSKISSWAEFEVSGDVLSVTVKTAQSGTAANLISWGIKKTK